MPCAPSPFHCAPAYVGARRAWTPHQSLISLPIIHLPSHLENQRRPPRPGRRRPIVGNRVLQLVDDAEQHRLALAGVAFDPEQSGVVVVAPSLEVGVIEDPTVRAAPFRHSVATGAHGSVRLDGLVYVDSGLPLLLLSFLFLLSGLETVP